MTVDTIAPRPIPTSRIGIFYGYCVCFIALGVALVGLNTVVSRMVDLSFPQASMEEQSFGSGTPEFNSFRDYKQQVLAARVERIGELRQKFAQVTDGEDSASVVRVRKADLQPLLTDALRVPTDEELQSEYNDWLAQQRAQAPARQLKALTNHRYEITRDLLSGLQLFLTGAILFILHWRWVQRRIERVPPAPSSPPQDIVPFVQQL